MPIFETFSLIYWALDAKKQGNGYGFPLDRPHFVFVKRLKTINLLELSMIFIDQAAEQTVLWSLVVTRITGIAILILRYS